MPGLTSKEATRIEEGLHVEETLVRKFGAYAQQCADPDCRRLMLDMQALHQRHYDMLLRQVANANVGVGQVAGVSWMPETGGRPAFSPGG